MVIDYQETKTDGDLYMADWFSPTVVVSTTSCLSFAFLLMSDAQLDVFLVGDYRVEVFTTGRICVYMCSLYNPFFQRDVMYLFPIINMSLVNLEPFICILFYFT